MVSKKNIKTFLSIKFWGDDRNREEIEQLCKNLEGIDIEVYCFRRDAENWGKIQFSPNEMMKISFEKIDQSDFLIAHIAQWPIGVGVEVGYARGHNIPVVCICPENEKLANTVAGVSEFVIKYNTFSELTINIKHWIEQRFTISNKK